MTITIKTGPLGSKLQRYYELLYVLVSRNLKVRYRGSFLGVYWSLLNPLIMTALYTAIFGAHFAKYYNNSTINYILAAFTGLIVINFFTAATTQSLVSVVSNGTILNKIQLPISIFPIATVFSNVFQFAVGSFPLLAIVSLITSKQIINIIALIIPVFSLISVSIGVGFIVSALYVFFRDLPYFYELVCFLLWISSPIFYPSEIVPDSVKIFLFLNPLSPIIESIRQISLSGNSPDLLLMLHSCISSLVIVTIGIVFFKTGRRYFMDLL